MSEATVSLELVGAHWMRSVGAPASASAARMMSTAIATAARPRGLGMRITAFRVFSIGSTMLTAV
jgi:hypothetical protein